MVKLSNIPSVYLVGGGAVLAALLYFKAKSKSTAGDGYGTAGFIQDVSIGVGSSAVHAVDSVVSGIAIGAGDVLGVPRVNKTACELAIAEGRTWDASFACSAGDFLSYVNPFK